MATTKQEIDTETGEVLGDQASDPELMQEISDQTDAELAEAEAADHALEEEANEQLSDEYDAAPLMMSEAAWNVGNRLLSACQDELAAAGIRQSNETKFILSRLERRIKTELLQGYREILAGSNPSVIAELKKVMFHGDKVEGNLVIDKNTGNRHELADFAGCDVVVVLAEDINEHVDGMQKLVEELSEMQAELPFDDVPPVAVGDTVQMLDGTVGTLEEAVDEQIVAADAAIEASEAEIIADADPVGEAIHQAEIDPARILMEDGVAVGLAPDPDCDICKGRGGWDVDTDTEEGVDEWVRCECVELPE